MAKVQHLYQLSVTIQLMALVGFPVSGGLEVGGIGQEGDLDGFSWKIL